MPKKVAPEKKVFGHFLLLDGSIWTETMLYDQGIPLRRSGQPTCPYSDENFMGPQKGLLGPKRALLGAPGVPIEVPEHMTSMLPTQLDQSVTVGTKLGLWGLLRTSRGLRGPLGPPKGLFGPLGVLIWPQGGPK